MWLCLSIFSFVVLFVSCLIRNPSLSRDCEDRSLYVFLKDLLAKALCIKIFILPGIDLYVSSFPPHICSSVVLKRWFLSTLVQPFSSYVRIPVCMYLFLACLFCTLGPLSIPVPLPLHFSFTFNSWCLIKPHQISFLFCAHLATFQFQLFRYSDTKKVRVLIWHSINIPVILKSFDSVSSKSLFIYPIRIWIWLLCTRIWKIDRLSLCLFWSFSSYRTSSTW